MNKIVKSRIKIFSIFFILIILSVILVLVSNETQFLEQFRYHMIKGLISDIGIVGAVSFGIAIALYFIRLIIRYYNPSGMDKIIKRLEKLKIDNKLVSLKNILLKENIMKLTKSVLTFLQKLIQKLHIPIALVGLSIITYHLYMAFYIGWKWSAGYVLGLVAYILLVLLTISGIARMFNKHIKGHKYLAFVALVFTVLHIIFI